MSTVGWLEQTTWRQYSLQGSANSELNRTNADVVWYEDYPNFDDEPPFPYFGQQNDSNPETDRLDFYECYGAFDVDVGTGQVYLPGVYGEMKVGTVAGLPVSTGVAGGWPADSHCVNVRYVGSNLPTDPSGGDFTAWPLVAYRAYPSNWHGTPNPTMTIVQTEMDALLATLAGAGPQRVVFSFSTSAQELAFTAQGNNRIPVPPASSLGFDSFNFSTAVSVDYPNFPPSYCLVWQIDGNIIQAKTTGNLPRRRRKASFAALTGQLDSRNAGT